MSAYRVKSVRALIDSYKTFKANPEQKWNMGIWPDESWNFTDFQKWFIKCLNEKINRQDSRTWRKLTPEYQLNLKKDSWRIKDYYRSRAVCSGCNLLNTPEMKNRYPHINTRMIND